MTRFYITTPLYYVNAQPHLGHAYTNIVTDCLARYQRLQGCNVFFLTGTDEHGQKIARAAAAAHQTPQAFVDIMMQPYQTLWTTLGMTHDDFIRTTEPRHVQAVQAFVQQLYDEGHLKRATYTGLYCVPCETYWTNSEVVRADAQAEPMCPNCQRPVEAIAEEGYDVQLKGEAQRWLQQHIQEHPEFIYPESRRNEVLGLLEQPLPSLCLTRPKARVPWGIPAPFDPEHVIYVWVDALINYLSAVGYAADTARCAQWWPADVHVIGKDILRHHALYWPILLHTVGLPPPRTILAHGWWTVGAFKMSKSHGTVVNPSAVAETFGIDAFRYFVLREIPFGQDGTFSETALTTRFNAELANDIGNLHFRTLSMMERYAQGHIPRVADVVPHASDQALMTLRGQCIAAFEAAMTCYDFVQAIGAILTVIGCANKYIEEQAPWKVAKAADAARLATILYQLVETLRVTTLALWPIMPQAAERMWHELGFTEPIWTPGDGLTLVARCAQFQYRQGQQIRKGTPLFPRWEPVASP